MYFLINLYTCFQHNTNTMNLHIIIVNFSKFTSTSSKVVYFDQLLGAVLWQRLCILTSSFVLFIIHIISYHDIIIYNIGMFYGYCVEILNNCELINESTYFLFNLWNKSPGLVCWAFGWSSSTSRFVELMLLMLSRYNPDPKIMLQI